MKSAGVYYIPSADKIWYVDKVDVYEDLKSVFTICNCYVSGVYYKKVLIKKNQFKRFIRIGDL